jgi:hypothetical protein
MFDKRWWRTVWQIVRNLAAGFVVVGSLALAAILFFLGAFIAHDPFVGTPGMRAALFVASFCCLATCIVVSMRFIRTGPGWSYPVAAAALVLAAALVAMSGIGEPETIALLLCLLALVTPWWAPG